MTETPETVLVGDELWFVIPPGWIELAAHADEPEAVAWFDRLLALTPDAFDAEQLTRLRATFVQARSQVPRDTVDSAGAIVTVWDEQVTLWQYTVKAVVGPAAGDLNLLAVVERFLTSKQGSAPLGEGDFVETFQTPDGRDGVAVHTTTTSDQGDLLKENIPATDPDRLGVVNAAVRLGRPRGADADRILLITGVAPNVEQRDAMALIAANIAVSARLRDSGAAPLPGRIDADVTGLRRDENPPEELPASEE